jgi:putative nucleotidyltransferase with HDIG domain
MQPKSRNLKENTVFVLPVIAFVVLIISTIPRLLLFSSQSHILARSLAVLTLSLLAVFTWICILEKESPEDYNSLPFLSIGIIIMICLSAVVFFTASGEKLLALSSLTFVTYTVVVWGRYHGLILTTFTAASIICNRIVESFGFSSAIELSIDTSLILLLAYSAISVSIQDRKPILLTIEKLTMSRLQPLHILDSAAFWDEIADCSDHLITPQTLSHLRSILMTQEMRDSYAIGHSIRVMWFASRILAKMNIPDNAKRTIQVACLFHDIGKIEVSQAILQKKGPLLGQEMNEIMEHTKSSVNILSRYSVFSNLEKLILHHHEWFDGSGYPNRLVQSEIPLGARVIAVADAFDAMASIRPYGNKKTTVQIAREIKKSMGTQFDPEIASIALNILSSDDHLVEMYHKAIL